MSNVKTADERAAERRADELNTAAACALSARRAVTSSRRVVEGRALLAAMRRVAPHSAHVATVNAATQREERAIIDAARFIEDERARMVQ